MWKSKDQLVCWKSFETVIIHCSRQIRDKLCSISFANVFMNDASWRTSRLIFFFIVDSFERVPVNRIDVTNQRTITIVEENFSSLIISLVKCTVLERIGTSIDRWSFNVDVKIHTNLAKNVTMFLGQGMGISIVTTSRIRKDQLQGQLGEDFVTEIEQFDYLGLAITLIIKYLIQQQQQRLICAESKFN